MIDTVSLQSPPLTDVQVKTIKQSCKRRSLVDVATGVLEWEITAGPLKGSFDHAIRVRVYDNDSPPFIVIEGSIHKALLGHNLFGGPLEPVSACRWFVSEVGRRAGVVLPPGCGWAVNQIDWAEVYRLPSALACTEFVRGMLLAEYPRRKVIRYEDESLMVPGSTTAFKVYHKGPEFKEHDRKRLSKYGLSDSEVFELQQSADCSLRLETSIKSPKLVYDFKGKPQVSQLTISYLEDRHDKEVKRLLKDAESGMELARTHLEVSRRLRVMYSPTLSRDLFGVWFQFATMGEQAYKSEVPRTTFYRQRRQLIKAGCSWNSTDVKVVPTSSPVPVGFSPVRSDPRRLTTESPEVEQALSPYRLPAPKV